MSVIVIAKWIIALIFFLIYILFAALIGYDLARKRPINALACILAGSVFLIGIMICVII